MAQIKIRMIYTSVTFCLINHCYGVQASVMQVKALNSMGKNLELGKNVQKEKEQE